MKELTKAQKKIFVSLDTVKGRRTHGMFMAQGIKCVHDTLPNFSLVALICQRGWNESDETAKIANSVDPDHVYVCKREDINDISTLTTSPSVLAIYQIPILDFTLPKEDKLYLALDGVQDPGNMGTIIRVCDWMGIDEIYASENCVDIWNPKVVQATMGAISSVNVHYCDLPDILRKVSAKMPIYGTFLDGDNIYKQQLDNNGIIVMGNEGNGISEEASKFVSKRLFIPSFNLHGNTSESLNVSIATAITLSEFRRNG